MISELKNGLKRIKDSIPYIPYFRDMGVILKIIVGSFYIVTLYTLVEVDSLTKFYAQLLYNIEVLGGYLVIEILALWLFAKLIDKKSSIVRIIIILSITAVNVYIITTIKSLSLDLFFLDINQSIRNIMISIGFVFFFLIYFDWYEKNINPAHIRAQLISLQSKMKPHFLFNTLNTIVYLIKENPTLASNMLINLSEIFRESLFEDDTNLNRIEQEIEMCKRYLDLEKIRLGNRLSYNLSIEEEIYKYMIPKYSLQPVVENSILHGIQNLEFGGTIEIIGKNNSNEIVLEVSNTHLTETKQHKKGNNISMDNLDKRLNVVFNGKHRLKNRIENNKYIVSISIPKRSK